MKKECLFCDTEFISKNAIAQSILCYAIRDNFPVNKGHILIIPFRHIQSFFELRPEEIKDMMLLAHDLRSNIDRELHPDGYNIGFNDGQAAGQTIPHVHMHLIPRYKGDVEDPTGGIRAVIPNKCNYKKL